MRPLSARVQSGESVRSEANRIVSTWHDEAPRAERLQTEQADGKTEYAETIVATDGIVSGDIHAKARR